MLASEQTLTMRDRPGRQSSLKPHRGQRGPPSRLSSVIQHRGQDHSRGGNQANVLTFFVASQSPAPSRGERRRWYSSSAFQRATWLHSESRPLASGMALGVVDGVLQMFGETALRAKARALIEQGKFPARTPVRMWGGPGAGIPCAICEIPITEDEKEFEIQFQRDGATAGFDRFDVHIRCFAAWELERADPSK